MTDTRTNKKQCCLAAQARTSFNQVANKKHPTSWFIVGLNLKLDFKHTTAITLHIRSARSVAKSVSIFHLVSMFGTIQCKCTCNTLHDNKNTMPIDLTCPAGLWRISTYHQKSSHPLSYNYLTQLVFQYWTRTDPFALCNRPVGQVYFKTQHIRVLAARAYWKLTSYR